MISKTKTLGIHSYFLSNPDAFFHRYADTGFKSKWAGLWSSGTKFLEFFDFKVGGEFLSEKNCSGIQYDYLKAVHFHGLGSGIKATQKLWMPREKPFLMIELSSKDELEAEFEFAANIRGIAENLHSRKYEVKAGKNVSVKSQPGKLVVSVLKGKHSFHESQQYKTHSPGGEKQCYFIPGIFKLSGKRIVLQIAANSSYSVKNNELLHKSKRLSKLCSSFQSDDEKLNQKLCSAASSTSLLATRHSFMAGLPWFQQFWARDVFWSLPALAELGLLEECRHSLLFFAANSPKGQIPNYIFGKEKTYNAIDSTPLFLIALEHFSRYSPEQAFLKKMARFSLKCLKFLESRRDQQDGFILHDSNSKETWMDTLNRAEKAVEVQALYIASLRAFSSLVSRLKKPEDSAKDIAASVEMRALKLSKEFEKAFFQNGFFHDRISKGKPDKARTVNALVPLFLGVSANPEVLKPFWSDEFLTPRGVTTLSKKDQKFSPSSYHSGKVWSLGNAWLCGSEFRHGSREKAWQFFNTMCSDFGRDALGCIGECWDAKTLKQTGCPSQLWGNAMLVRIFSEFALGIEPDAMAKKISLNRNLSGLDSEVRVRLKLGSDEGTLKISPREQTAKFSIPGYRVEMR